MSDTSLIRIILVQIHHALETVETRFKAIQTSEDFTHTPEGKEKLDGICMQLIAIGESLKKIDKLTDKSLLSRYSEIDWSGAMGVRDIIAHHYFDIDAEEIFWICENHVTPMRQTVKKILDNLLG